MFARVVLLPLLLVVAACTVNIANLDPPLIERPQIAKKKDFGLNAVVALQTKIRKLAHGIYEERARGSNYSKGIRSRLEKLIILNRTLGQNIVTLHQQCPNTQGVLLTACTKYTRAAFKTAELSEELYGLLLGYTIAGLETNAAFLTTENEQRANKLVTEQRILFEAEAAPLQRFADAIRQTKCCIAPLQKSDSGGNPAVVFSGNTDKATDKQLADAIRKASEHSVLTAYPDVKITITMSKLDIQTTGDQVIRVAAMAIFILPVVGLPGSGGDATVSATVSQNGSAPIKLTLNSYLINARDPDTLIRLVANRIVGAAHFALLRKEMGL